MFTGSKVTIVASGFLFVFVYLTDEKCTSLLFEYAHLCTSVMLNIFPCVHLLSEHVLTVSEVPGSLSLSGAGEWMWTSILPSWNSEHSSKSCVHLPDLPHWTRKKEEGRKLSEYVQVPGVCWPLTFTIWFSPHDHSRRKNTAHDLHVRNLGLREVKGFAQSHNTVSVSCNWNPDLSESKPWAPLRPPRWRWRRVLFSRAGQGRYGPMGGRWSPGMRLRGQLPETDHTGGRGY